MLEKVHPYLNELEQLYKKYAEKKRTFRKKNAAKLAELKNDTLMQQTIRDIIAIYDQSNFLGKIWISLFSPINYYKNLLQYYDLNECIQKLRSDTLKELEKIQCFEEMLALLRKFDAAEHIKQIVSTLYQALLKIHAVFKTLTPLEESKSVSPLPDEAPKNFQEVQYHNTRIVKNMVDLLKEMREINWEKLVCDDESKAYKRYEGLIEKFEVALKRCSQLRILAHPDHQSTDLEGRVFIKVQETYNRYKAHKEAIKIYVKKHGLKTLHTHIPQEEQSVMDLLETLHAMLQGYMEKCDAHLQMLHACLPEQTKKLEGLTQDIGTQSEVVDVLKEQSKKQNQDLERQTGELDSLKEKSKQQSAHSNRQLMRLAELEKKMQLYMGQKTGESGGGASSVQAPKNDNAHTHIPLKSTFFQAGGGAIHSSSQAVGHTCSL